MRIRYGLSRLQGHPRGRSRDVEKALARHGPALARRPIVGSAATRRVVTYAVRGDRWSTSWSSIAPTVYWIFAIIEVARIPARQFYAAGSNKTFWIWVVVLLQIIGALLWLFLRRADVLEAEDWADEDEDHRRTGTWTRKRVRFGGPALRCGVQTLLTSGRMRSGEIRADPRPIVPAPAPESPSTIRRFPGRTPR
jgi:hypothetical protein